MKTLIVIAAAVAVLSATGCCLPLHGGRHGHDRWSEGQRPAPQRAPAPAPAPAPRR